MLRVLYAAALLFALWVTYEENVARHGSVDINSIAAFTAAFFGAFGVIQLVAVLLIGPALAAGAIAQERERRTLEYLYASPLSVLEIIIGKLGGRVLQILYLVLSGVPVLALAMLLGGIAPKALVSLTAVTLSTILFVTMVSLAVSACTAKARDAVVRAYLVFFCLWVLPFLAGALAFNSRTVWATPVVMEFLVANPLVTFLSILTGDSPWGPLIEPWPLLLQMVRNQMLTGVTVLLLATFFMRRIHLREAGKAARARRWRIQFFRGEVGDKPMYWKELYAEPGSSRLGLLGYGLIGLIFVAVCGFTIYMLWESLHEPYMRNGESFVGYAIGMSTFLGCCGLLLVTARAAGSITAEKERDSWLSLIGTPLDGRQIVQAKVLGSLWSLRGLVPFLAVLWLPAVLWRPSYFLGVVFSLANLAILAAFLATLGVRFSLGSKSTLRAVGAALGTAIFLGGGYLCCCCPLAFLGPRSGDGFQLGLAPCMPFLVAFPGAASMMIDQTYGPPHEFGGFLAAYLIGTIGYIVATLVLLAATIETFDERSGRVVRRFGHVPRRTP